VSRQYVDNGGYTVLVTVADDEGAIADFTAQVAVGNVAPSATFNAPTSVSEGSAINLSLTGPSDASPVDTAAGFSYAFDCGSGYGAFSSSNSTTCSTSDQGSRTVRGKIQDKDFGIREYTQAVAINNVAPTAGNDSYSTNKDTMLSVAAPGVLSNDTDVVDTLTAVLVSGPFNGTLTFNSNGSFTYLPNANFHGTDTFKYKAYDGTAYSGETTVTINVNRELGLQSPSDAAVFNSCSLINNYQPTFSWNTTGVYAGYKILFSRSQTDFTTWGIEVAAGSAMGTSNSWKPSSWNWETIMRASNNRGTIRPIYWKVIGTKSDRTKVESEVRTFSIGTPQAQIVSINAPLNGAMLDPATPPVFDFDTNCNKRFRIEISSLSDFSVSTKIKTFDFTAPNPNLALSMQKTLSSFQWNGIKRLVGTGTGYFRIKAWDGLSRLTVSEVRTFSIQ
jgi:hypothetical protein